MKKLLTIMAVFLFTGSSTVVTAQNYSVARNNRAADVPASAFESSDAGSSFRSMNVSERVSKKFIQAFPGIIKAVWVNTGNRYVVRFTSDSIQNCVFLTKRGNCQSRILYYTEKNLPAAIRNQVKSAYYDFSITSVKEVHHNKATAYLVTVADETTWKVIRVVDGETAVLEEHVKG